jgi:hypothetical protein
LVRQYIPILARDYDLQIAPAQPGRCAQCLI